MKEKLNIGIIGTGGKGARSIQAVAQENIIALCDVDAENLDKATALFPDAEKYVDFRELLENKNVEAVVINTPDHTHAVASVMAMKMGKHVYCEKPLTHSVYEARMVAEIARQSRVATQMGNQTHSSENYRRAVELIQLGVIGDVREVHAWTTLCWSGYDRPCDKPPIPKHLHWDLWLGPAPERPYHPNYHPFEWRGWWDFGTGSLGDLGCHLMDPAFWALELEHPQTIEAEGPTLHPESTPPWLIVRYEFPERGSLPPVNLTFYHGDKRPPIELMEGEPMPEHASLFVGDKGKLLVGFQGFHKLLPESNFVDFEKSDSFMPEYPGHYPGHYLEWVIACKTGQKTGSNFSYAGPLTEAVLLGNVAYQVGNKIEWDNQNLKAIGCPEANQFIKRNYREGWSLE